MVGKTLSHYAILDKLGAGGMGEVYRAEDTKLGRQVAVKVLPEAFAGDPERMARFEREARTLASLNHQNIAAIYGLEEAEGKRFLVMELVEGQSLDLKLKKGTLLVDEALDICRQLAEGIEAAHEKGIIHRDLKPSNIKVSPEGKVKVLDFGLAKALYEEKTGPVLMDSPTLTAQMTQPGVILGTAPYMSPEQAKGKSVDKRTDIWAFGCVLYECLTGKRAFDGETVTEIIASVLKTDPDWKQVPSRVPPVVRQLLRECLSRESHKRLKSMTEARSVLEDTSYSRVSAGFRRIRASVGGLRRLWWIPIVLALTAVAFWQLRPSGETPRGEPTLLQLTANSLEESILGAAISPDGKYLAFVDSKGLHLQLLSSRVDRILEMERDLTPYKVLWSSDSTRLLLLATQGDEAMSLWSVSVLGGQVNKIHEYVHDAAVSPDGSKLAFIPGGSTRRQCFREIWISGMHGEDPHRILTAEPAESIWNLAWAPDSQRLAFGTWEITTTWEEMAVSIKTCRGDGTEKELLQSGVELFQHWTGSLPFIWAPDGRLIFSRRERPGDTWDQTTSNLWSIQTDVGKGKTIGKPRRLTQFQGYNVRDLSISQDGKKMVAYLVRNQADVWVARLNDEGTSFVVETQLTRDDWADMASSWDADSRSVLFWSYRGSRVDSFLMDISGQSLKTYEISTPAEDYWPTFSPDGRYFLYIDVKGTIWRMPKDGGPAEDIVSGLPLLNMRCRPGTDLPCLAGYIDGAEYVFITFDPDTGDTEELLRISYRIPFTNWELSPDGTKIAVVHNDDDTIRIISVPSGEEKTIRVKGWDNFEFVTWAADGQRLFINAGFARAGRYPDLLSVDLDGNVTVLRHAPYHWHVQPVASPDGKYVAFSCMPFHGNAWLITDF
jgi:serine/threonine protein kinase